ISGGTSHSSIGPISAIGRLLMRRSSRGRDCGGGETTCHGNTRPRRWPVAPRDRVLAPGKNEGPPGGCSDGPSICLSELPQGFALPTGWYFSEAPWWFGYYQPALPPPPPTYDTTKMMSASAAIDFTSFRSLRVE